MLWLIHLPMDKVINLNNFVCCLCGEGDAKQTFTAFDFDNSVESFELLQCNGCGLAQTWPVPDSLAMDRYYSNDYYGGGAKKFSGIVEALTVMGNSLRARKILSVIKNVKINGGSIKILDIGCGRANLLQRLKEMGCKCFGIERKEYQTETNKQDFEIHKGSLEGRNFKDSFFDAVVIWHVLEHLHKPLKTLDEVTRITREGGIVAIAVPNFSSLQSRWFKTSWFHLDLPRHLFHFNVDNLSRALVQRGFIIHSVSTCSLEQNLFGFVQSLMNRLKLFGKPNEFYQLLKSHSGLAKSFKLALWTLVAVIMLPFAFIELGMSCLMNKGASVVIFARKI